MNTERKQAQLLPSDAEHDGPLFFVIAIIVFLASLAAIVALLAVQNVNHWKSALQSEMTVQIISGDPAQTQAAASLLLSISGVKAVRVASREEAKSLLEPWLGADNIPDDLPIPLLVHIRLSEKDPASSENVSEALKNAGIEASIDDHQRWAGDLARSSGIIQILSITVLALLVSASIAVTGFATRSGLAARKDLVNVLHLVGARDQVIARLFGRRFVLLGLKAGASGAGLAAISIIILMLGGVGDASFMGLSIQPGLGSFLLLLPVPVITAMVGGWTAHRSVLNSLRRQV